MSGLKQFYLKHIRIFTIILVLIAAFIIYKCWEKKSKADKMTTIYGKWIKIFNSNNSYYIVYKDTCDTMYYTRYVGNNKFTLYDINKRKINIINVSNPFGRNPFNETPSLLIDNKIWIRCFKEVIDF